MHVRLDIHSDNVAHVIFDRQGSSANIFDADAMRDLATHVEAIRSNTSITGVVFESAKNSIFIAGADVTAFIDNGDSAEALEQLVADGQAVFTMIEALSVPTLAAIHGACLGGGLEMAIACDYRIASPDSATKIGLPETSLGIVPGWGGCARLPKLIGLPNALMMILQGKRVVAAQARKYGLVDQVVPKFHFHRWSRILLAKGKPTRPSHWKTNNPLMARVIASKARSALTAKTRGHYPAPFRALDIVIRGLRLPLERTLELERKTLVELIRGEISNNLVRIFFMQERAKHLSLKDVSFVESTGAEELSPINDVAVIGAGTMGAGIAQRCAARNHNVILKDLSTDALAKGLAAIGKVFAGAAKRRSITKTDAERGMDRVHATHENIPLQNIDMVIEAATENMDTKKKIFAGLEAATNDHAILATNTSALSISDLAASTSRPEAVVGVHFFNPVHLMQLVEIVVGAETSPETVGRTIRFVQQLGKMPVVTRDTPGFAVNRILMPYLTEAGHLADAGATVRNIDEAMLDFGMPMGPLRLIDEVGIDVANHVAQFFGASFGERLPAPDSLGKMVTQNLLGRKTSRGFYTYPSKGDPAVNSMIASFTTSADAKDLSRDVLQERMVLMMLNEAARCMEEEVVSSPEDIDFAMIMGTGFAPFRGGPLRYTDALGATHVVERLEHYAQTHGIRFEPCDALKTMAATNDSWYHTGTSS